MRTDSAVSMQDIEIAQLKQQIVELQQERNVWKDKYRDAKDEVFKVNSESSKNTRRVRTLEKQCADLQSQLLTKDQELGRLREEHPRATKRSHVKLLSASSQTTSLKSSASLLDRSAAAELKSVRSQLMDLQHEYSRLKQLHIEYDCADTWEYSQSKVLDANQLRQAAEEQCAAYGHVFEANKLLEKQALAAHKLFEESTRDLRVSEAKIKSLEAAVEIHRAEAYNAQDKANVLHDEVMFWKPKEGDLDHDIDNVLPTVSVSDTDSVIDDSGAPKQQLARVDTDLESDSITGIAANIIINVDKSQQNNWNLLKRMQAVIKKASVLDIVGPPDLVAELITAMRDTDADHKEQTVAAAHWQKVANDALAEVDNLHADVPSGPTCTAPGHKNLVDELEAKNLQLHLQAELVAKWQKQMSGVNDAMEKATADLRKQGVRGV
jgi:hypothetical protein